jgi:hypothetical protein
VHSLASRRTLEVEQATAVEILILADVDEQNVVLFAKVDEELRRVLVEASDAFELILPIAKRNKAKREERDCRVSQRGAVEARLGL